jgi:hypothetical protein
VWRPEVEKMIRLKDNWSANEDLYMKTNDYNSYRGKMVLLGDDEGWTSFYVCPSSRCFNDFSLSKLIPRSRVHLSPAFPWHTNKEERNALPF